MSRLVVTTRPLNPAKPSGAWAVIFNGQLQNVYDDHVTAERHADNLREHLLSLPAASHRRPSSITKWVVLSLAAAILATLALCSQARAAGASLHASVQCEA